MLFSCINPSIWNFSQQFKHPVYPRPIFIYWQCTIGKGYPMKCHPITVQGPYSWPVQKRNDLLLNLDVIYHRWLIFSTTYAHRYQLYIYNKHVPHSPIQNHPTDFLIAYHILSASLRKLDPSSRWIVPGRVWVGLGQKWSNSNWPFPCNINLVTHIWSNPYY